MGPVEGRQVRLAILAIAALLACVGMASAGAFVRSYEATEQTYLDQAAPDSIHNGESPVILNVSDSGASKWIVLQFVVPALGATETLDSARVVAYGAGGSTQGLAAIYGHRVKRAIVYAGATYNNYAAGSAWASAGAWGADDCDTSTDYGYGADGHFYEMTTPTETVQDSLTIARGAGFKTFVTDWVLGKTVNVIWHSVAAGPGALSWPYGTSALATLKIYGTSIVEDTQYPSRRRRAMMDGE